MVAKIASQSCRDILQTEGMADLRCIMESTLRLKLLEFIRGNCDDRVLVSL